MNEMDLISAFLSGQLDHSILITPYGNYSCSLRIICPSGNLNHACAEILESNKNLINEVKCIYMFFYYMLLG